VVRRSAIWLAIGVGVCALAAATAGPAASATAVTTTFSTPGTFTYQVPAGVCQVSAVAVGASGGNSSDFGPLAGARLHGQLSGSAGQVPQGWPTPGDVHTAAPATGVGGAGGSATATLPVTPGETLVVSVGGQGDDYGDTGAAGTPDGGAGGAGTPGAGGGGSSDVRQGGTDLSHRVLVGGGGGGAGFEAGVLISDAFIDGGAGGGSNGLNGDPQNPSDLAAGGGGTQSSGGAGGFGFIFGPNGDAGGPGQGGAGAPSPVFSGSGGGGGYFGGGGGASAIIDEAFAGGNAGGGGSGFGPPGTVFQTGGNTGNGRVSITADPANSGCVEATAAFTG
jgi:hypothetical protein